MKLGIMQPYFFPYLGYFDLINCTDKWIVFDVVQYIRKGWMNRNRIHHPNLKDDLYFLVPIEKSPRETLIKDIRISDDPNWRRKIRGQLEHYKKRAPHFKETTAFVEDCLATQERSLCRLNVEILRKTCELLGIDFQFEIFSEMNIDLGIVNDPGDWALRISELLGAKTYINPPGGEAIFDRQKFKSKGIDLILRNVPTYRYSCRGYEFIPNLSIIDVLMFNSVSEIQSTLSQFVENPNNTIQS